MTIIKLLKDKIEIKGITSGIRGYLKKYYKFKNYVGKVSYNNISLEKHASENGKKIAIVRVSERGHMFAVAIMSTDTYEQLCEIVDDGLSSTDGLNFMLHMQDYLFETSILGKFDELKDDWGDSKLELGYDIDEINAEQDAMIAAQV